MDPLPIEVQSVEQMAMRFPFALEKVYSQAAVDDPKTSPAWKRKHVFDFKGGLRLIVSRDEQEELGVLIHIIGAVWRNDRQPNYQTLYWAADQATWMVGELNSIARVDPSFIKNDEDLIASTTSQKSVHLFFRDLEERRREPGA